MEVYTVNYGNVINCPICMTHLLTDFNYKFHITILQILQQFYFRFMRHVYNIFQQNFEFNEIEI